MSSRSFTYGMSYAASKPGTVVVLERLPMTDNMQANASRIEELTVSPPEFRSRASRAWLWIRNSALAVAIVALGISVYTTSQRTQAACLEGNRVRAQVASLWQYVIDESAKRNPHPTAEQSRQMANFQIKILETYAPRKC
jgi:hypothetical protein